MESSKRRKANEETKSYQLEKYEYISTPHEKLDMV